jgi:hypothetical protein
LGFREGNNRQKVKLERFIEGIVLIEITTSVKEMAQFVALSR